MNDLKRELCNYLIKNNMVKEYDVIKHSYTNIFMMERLYRLKKFLKRRNKNNG